MPLHRATTWVVPILVLVTGVAFGQERAASYARDVKPFLTRYCVECHFGKEPEGGLNLETFQALLAGGEHGPVVTPGKADDSRMGRMVEGKTRPRMPPKKARQPKPEELAVLRS